MARFLHLKLSWNLFWKAMKEEWIGAVSTLLRTSLFPEATTRKSNCGSTTTARPGSSTVSTATQTTWVASCSTPVWTWLSPTARTRPSEFGISTTAPNLGLTRRTMTGTGSWAFTPTTWPLLLLETIMELRSFLFLRISSQCAKSRRISPSPAI